MGAGASVVQEESTGDLETVAIVAREYHRLSCRQASDVELSVRENEDGELTLTDEELFAHLKGLVAQRFATASTTADAKDDDTNATGPDAGGDAAVAVDADAKDAEVPITTTDLDAKQSEVDAVVPDTETNDVDMDAGVLPTETEAKGADINPGATAAAETEAKDADTDTEVHLEAEAKTDEPTSSRSADMDPAVLLNRPLTTDTLLALANTITDDDVDDDQVDGDMVPLVDDAIKPIKTRSLGALHDNGFGMHSAHHSSHSCNSASRSTFDLTQNLTPVFTTDVLLDPATLKLMSSYAAQQTHLPHASDWIKFWVEIDQLAQLPSHSYTNRRLHKIYDKFLSPEAPSPVCVTSAMLSEIEAALKTENISAGIYADAQQICLTALEQSVFPRFKENRLFKKMIDVCAPSTTANHSRSSQELLLQQEDYSLQGVLTHPAKLRFLKTYCMEALALENLLFYLEVEDCKRLPNLSFIVNKTRKIYDRYCSPTSRNGIELPDRVLHELHAAMENKQPLVPKLFYEAQLLVFQQISDELWRGFCRAPEYLEYSRKLKPDHKKRVLPTAKNNARLAAEQTEQMTKKIDGMNEFQLIEMAMHYPVAKLIPTDASTAAAAMDTGLPTIDAITANTQVFTPHEQLTILLSDSFGKKFYKQFLHKRGVDQFLAFCEEVDDFKLLPGIEFLQHTAKKIYRKYILPSAKLQVDMSRAMRDEIAERLLNPSIDMFKRISQRVRHGMLQDSLPRFVKSSFYSDLRKLTKQFKEISVEADLKAIDQAAKKGKLELMHLDLLLTNQLCMKQFRLFLESQHCSENLMLYEDIEHFRRLPSYQIVLRSAKKIYDKYLNPANTRNPLIPISDALRARVVAQLDAASRTTFDEVENECYEHMRNVVVPDFLDSRIFMALVGTWAVVDDEYPAEMLKGEFEMAFLRHRFHLVQESKGLSRNTATPKGMA